MLTALLLEPRIQQPAGLYHHAARRALTICSRSTRRWAVLRRNRLVFARMLILGLDCVIARMGLVGRQLRRRLLRMGVLIVRLLRRLINLCLSLEKLGDERARFQSILISSGRFVMSQSARWCLTTAKMQLLSVK